jgi:hypothetical protein
MRLSGETHARADTVAEAIKDTSTMQMRLVNNETNRSHIASACASLVFVVVAGACALYTAPGASLRVQKPANFEIVRWVAPHNIVVSENRIMATQSAAASIFEPVPMDRSTADLEQLTQPAKIEQTHDEAVIRVGPKPSIAESVKTVPVPIPRPHELADDLAITSISGAEDRGIFERLFGSPSPPNVASAYASPEPSAAEESRKTPKGITGAYDKSTAVYDISGRTLYLPNGTKLEAHSGLGDLLDDPEHVNVRMRGATPPAVYELKLREKLFHGVQALRLSPIGNSQTLGRAGLLAHPFMLGPNGDSNGCVSIKDYDAFLQAYISGEIKRLAVVAGLN